jgi:hypothetical protein
VPAVCLRRPLPTARARCCCRRSRKAFDPSPPIQALDGALQQTPLLQQQFERSRLLSRESDKDLAGESLMLNGPGCAP